MMFENKDAIFTVDDDPEHQTAYCSRDCPFYIPYDHPYYHHTVFCSHVLQNLAYWDGLLAMCQTDFPVDNDTRTKIELAMNAEKRLNVCNDDEPICNLCGNKKGDRHLRTAKGLDFNRDTI